MIIRKLDGIQGSECEVGTDDWTSRRLLLQKDGMGFSLHDTLIRKGASLKMHYKHHLEAVYCIEGQGSVTDLKSGEVHPLQPGTVYALNENDEHILKAETPMRFVCVFNPPVTGDEVHGDDGAYPPQVVKAD
ncbi:MAG: ectoine synthase [Polyangiales bacterium]